MVKSTISNKEEPLKAEIVLKILRDSYLQQCQYDPETEPDIELTFESTVEEWRNACDLVAWKPLGKAMNRWFQIDHTDDQWHEVLEPAESKNLLGVCQLISHTATRPTLVPLNIFGKSCLEAGAFITLRTELAKHGVPVKALRPSMPLHPWLIKYWGELSDVVGKVSPEALPPVRIEKTFIQRLSYWLFGIGIISWPVSYLINLETVSMVATASFISGLLLFIITSRMKPKRVSFDNLETIGDVCRLISASVKSRCNA
jgi:hypothetical protein